jgi:hypothetical protein
MQAKHGISIWYFIGLQMLIYGVLILGASIYGAVHGEPAELHMTQYHPGIWWGGLMAAIGVFYVIRFRPSVHAGEEPHANE